MIHELTDQFSNERLIVIEDTAEIQCAAKDVQYHTSLERTISASGPHGAAYATGQDPSRGGGGTRSTRFVDGLEHRPRRGIPTVHANNAAAGLTRLSTLVSMHPDAPREIEPLIGEAVDLVIHIERRPGKDGSCARSWR